MHAFQSPLKAAAAVVFAAGRTAHRTMLLEEN